MLTRMRETLRPALAVLALTSVHHAYGAYIYHTPWRYHAVVVGVLTGALLGGAYWLMSAHETGRPARVGYWAFVIVAATVPFAMFGVFEGAYNHVLKDVLYFSGAGPSLMQALFPAPTYEMPNNLLFEVTGVLQAWPGLSTGVRLVRALRDGGSAVAGPAPVTS
jgi:hypothetical protein